MEVGLIRLMLCLKRRWTDGNDCFRK